MEAYHRFLSLIRLLILHAIIARRAIAVNMKPQSISPELMITECVVYSVSVWVFSGPMLLFIIIVRYSV